jgi:hypothetical protein
MAYHHAMSLARRAGMAVLLALLLSPPVAAQDPAAVSATTDRLVESALDYRITLDRLATAHEEQLLRATGMLERYTDLFRRGLVSRREVEDAASLAAAARARAEKTRKDIEAVETLITEAEARRQMALRAPAHPSRVETASFFRGGGTHGWSPTDLPGIERFFAGRFGHPLPVSALGQTPVHDRLGFDHRHAADVAVHPDSPEGRALIDYLRANDIPFLAYRGAVAGAATGAHVHIGLPSERLVAR